MTERRAGVSAVVLTVLVVGTMLVLVMFAARTGPQRIVDGPLVDPDFGRVDASSTPPTSQTPDGFSHGTLHQSALLTWIGWFIRAGVVLLVAWLVYRGLRLLRDALRELRDRERPDRAPERLEFDVLEDADELVEVIRADADDQRALLRGGSARNAIVACWNRFEEQAGRLGLDRRPWETSSEFTLRMLDVVSADGGAVARLERLYHEARFSEHMIDEDRRTAAVEALEAIYASLPTRTRVGR